MRLSTRLAALVPLALLSAAPSPLSPAQAAQTAVPTMPPWVEPYREPAARLIEEATKDTFAWRRLAALTDTVGHRLSGSPELDRAIQWAVDEMKRDGLENVHVGSSRVDLQACKLEYSIVSPK